MPSDNKKLNKIDFLKKYVCIDKEYKKLQFFKRYGILKISEEEIIEYLINKRIVQRYEEFYKTNSVTSKMWELEIEARSLAPNQYNTIIRSKIRKVEAVFSILNNTASGVCPNFCFSER